MSPSYPDFKKRLADNHYPTDNDFWWRSTPYAFRLYLGNATDEKDFYEVFLPIAPQNLSISTTFASNITPTLYGTVEEHTEQRYYDIQISGTTGLVSQYKYDSAIQGDLVKASRSSFTIDQSAGILGGFFGKTISTAMNAWNQTKSIFSRPNESGMPANLETTGYATFHNLYKFFLEYKRDAAGINGAPVTDRRHPLWFANYKDGVIYKCNLRSFTLTRSVSDPMLYVYGISLRAYDMQPVGQVGMFALEPQRLRDLGLDGVKGSSLLTDIKSTASKVKGVIGTIVGGRNIIGR